MKDASGRAGEILGHIHTRHVPEPTDGTGALTFSEVLGRRIRVGDWNDQRVSTCDKVRAALEEGDFAEAAELGDFFADEAEVIYEIYRSWMPQLIDFLLDRGLSEYEVTALNERILALLRLPDGRWFHARQLWAEFQAEVRDFVLACGAQSRDDAVRLLDEMWHARDVEPPIYPSAARAKCTWHVYKDPREVPERLLRGGRPGEARAPHRPTGRLM